MHSDYTKLIKLTEVLSLLARNDGMEIIGKCNTPVMLQHSLFIRYHLVPIAHTWSDTPSNYGSWVVSIQETKMI